MDLNRPPHAVRPALLAMRGPRSLQPKTRAKSACPHGKQELVLEGRAKQAHTQFSWHKPLRRHTRSLPEGWEANSTACKWPTDNHGSAACNAGPLLARVRSERHRSAHNDTSLNFLRAPRTIPAKLPTEQDSGLRRPDRLCVARAGERGLPAGSTNSPGHGVGASHGSDARRHNEQGVHCRVVPGISLFWRHGRSFSRELIGRVPHSWRRRPGLAPG